MRNMLSISSRYDLESCWSSEKSIGHLPFVFQMADRSQSGSLELEQFVLFYKMLTQRDEVWRVFQDYSGDGETLMLEELENFLSVEQQEGEGSARHAKELMERQEPSGTGQLKWRT